MKNDGIDSANISALHCIDLSSPDIHTSVSLLKQVPLSLSLLYVYRGGSTYKIRGTCAPLNFGKNHVYNRN